MILSFELKDQHFLLLVGLLAVVSAVGIVTGYGGSNPESVGHSFGELSLGFYEEDVPAIKTGHIIGCRPEYGGASDIIVSTGSVEIDGLMAELASVLVLTWSELDEGSEATDTVYYVYLEKPSQSGGSPTGHISATPPQFVATKGGKYHLEHLTWRYVGAFWNDAGGNIRKFGTIGNRDILEVDLDGTVTMFSGVRSQTTGYARAPPKSIVKFNTYMTYSPSHGSYSNAYIRKFGDSNWQQIGSTYQAYGAQMQSSGEVQCDDQRRLEAYATVYGLLSIYETGWVDDR